MPIGFFFLKELVLKELGHPLVAAWQEEKGFLRSE
jgi:hypothetical protein